MTSAAQLFGSLARGKKIYGSHGTDSFPMNTLHDSKQKARPGPPKGAKAR